MNVVVNLISRNLKMYLRNRTAVFFSFLSVLIIIGMYALFLGDVQVDSIRSIAGDRDGITWLADSWVMSGIIAVNTINITLASLGVMIDDIESKATKDFLSSPIKRGHVVLGYIMSSWILGILISLIAFGAIELYIVSKGGQFLSIVNMLQAFGVITISVITYSAMLFFTMTYLRNSNAFATFSTIIGTAVGFLAGIYVPIGVLPSFVQKAVSIFPISYSASLMRQIFMEKPMEIVFDGASSNDIASYQEFFGVKLFIGEFYLSPLIMVLTMLIVSMVFYGLSVLRIINNKIND